MKNFVLCTVKIKFDSFLNKLKLRFEIIILIGNKKPEFLKKCTLQTEVFFPVKSNNDETR